MSTITMRDGATVYYKDWGRGRPLVFSHGWPLNADAWEDAMFYFSSRGYRCIAADRRGHGRSSQSWNGNDLDTYADDLAELVVSLDLKGAVHIGHSTGGGEVVRHIGRHGTGRVAAAILVSDITPLMLKTDANPDGTPLAAFDRLRRGVLADRAQFYRELAEPFYGANRSGAHISQALKDTFWTQSMMTGFPACYFCIEAFSETDFNADLRTIDVPTLIIHGDDDQIVPIAASAILSSEIIRSAELVIYEGAPHGLPATMKDRLHGDLERFIGGISA